MTLVCSLDGDGERDGGAVLLDRQRVHVQLPRPSRDPGYVFVSCGSIGARRRTVLTWWWPQLISAVSVVYKVVV